MVAAWTVALAGEAFRGENRATPVDQPHASPHFGIPELEGVQAGLGRPCRPSRGAPDLTRRWVWRKSNLGPGGFVLSSSPHDLRERPACQSFLWGRVDGIPSWLENPQKTPESRISDYPISISGTSARLNTTKRFDFGRGRGAPPDGTDRRRPRRRNTQVLACPDRVKHVGCHITKPHHLGPFTAARKTTPDGSKARPPDFFHPLLLHDDI